MKVPATAVVACLFLQQAVGAFAADSIWQVPAGNWSDPASWVGGNVPANDPATQVIFPAAAAPFLSTIDATRPLWQVNGITVNNDNGGAFHLAPGTALQFVGPSPFIRYAGTGSVSLDADLVLNSTLSFKAGIYGLMAPLGEIQLTGTLSGPAGIAIEGANVLLSGSNSFAGGIMLLASTSAAMTALHIAQPAAIGTGDLFLQGKPSAEMQLKIDAGAGSSTNLAHTVHVTNALTLFAGAGTNHTFILPSLAASGNSTIHLTSTGAGSGNTWQITSLTISGALEIAGSDAVNIGPITQLSGASLIFSNSGGVHLTSANNYSGGTSIEFPSSFPAITLRPGFSGISTSSGPLGTLFADVAGALGTGPVHADNGSLFLNATNAAQNTISGPGTTFYNANGAAGGHALSSNVTFGPAVTSFSNGSVSDTFSMAADFVLSGPNSVLSLLTRGNNLTLATNAQIENTEGVLPAVQNLGTNADLVLRLHAASNLPINVGPGTPWGGIANFIGTVSTTGNIELAGGTFGDGTVGSFNILTPSGNQPIVLNVRGANTLASSLSDYSGVSTINVAIGGLTLSAPNALGGGNGSTPVPVFVAASHGLTVRNSLAINGPVTFAAGSTLGVGAPGLNGTGALLRSDAPMSLFLEDPLSLSGTQLTLSFIHAGDTIGLIGDDIQGLGAIVQPVNFYAGIMTYHLHDGLNLDATTLSGGPTIIPSPAATGSNSIHIGPGGGTISLFTPPTSSALIGVPIITQGVVSVPTTNLTVSGGISGTGSVALVGNGSGTMLVTGAATYTGSTTVATFRTMEFGGGVSHSVGALAGSGRVLVDSGTSLTSDGALVGTLTLNGAHTIRSNGSGSNTSKISGLSLASATTGAFTATLNLNDNKLILQSSSPADKQTKLTLLAAAINSGSNHNTWTGAGITSSTLQGTANSQYALALFENGAPGMGLSSFGGQPVNSASLLVAIAHLGNANGDNLVNVVDLGIVANNFQQPNNSWSRGDLNMDGVVNVVDLGIVANNFQQTSIFPLAASQSVIGNAPVSAVPEPSTLLLVAAGAGSLRARRRRTT